MCGERLLVNYWYASNVGHALEGLRYCLGYKTANPEMGVSLLLNVRTPVELTALCPFRRRGLSGLRWLPDGAERSA